jgi:hypothetical protein
VVRRGLGAREVRRAELAGAHEDARNAPGLRAKDVGHDVVSHHEHVPGGEPEVEQGRLEERRGRLPDDGMSTLAAASIPGMNAPMSSTGPSSAW